MTVLHTRSGSGKPLLLVHGLGGSRRSWTTVERDLAQAREVIALDLPGHGQTPAEPDSGTFEGLARSLESWLISEGLVGVDMVGSSLGARLVLEMARRGHSGAVVALDPGGFWRGWERVLPGHDSCVDPARTWVAASPPRYHSNCSGPHAAHGSTFSEALEA
jgi:pimeloyl-ACP methyl ester carboxylesterase